MSPKVTKNVNRKPSHMGPQAMQPTNQQNQPTKPKHGPLGLNPVELVELHEKGLSKVQIAKLKGCSVSAVKYHLRSLTTKFAGLEKFKSVESDLLRIKVKDMVSSLTTGKIESMSGRDLVWCIAVLTDKIRLLEDKTTSNVGFKGIMLHVTENLDKIKEVESKLSELRKDARLQGIIDE